MSNCSLAAAVRRRQSVGRLTEVIPGVTSSYGRDDVVLSSVNQRVVAVPAQCRRAGCRHCIHFTRQVDAGVLAHRHTSICRHSHTSASACSRRCDHTQPRRVCHKHNLCIQYTTDSDQRISTCDRLPRHLTQTNADNSQLNKHHHHHHQDLEWRPSNGAQERLTTQQCTMPGYC